MSAAFDAAVKQAIHLHSVDSDSEAVREALALGQSIIGEVAVEMRVQGKTKDAPQWDALAKMQAKLAATKSLLMPRQTDL